MFKVLKDMPGYKKGNVINLYELEFDIWTRVEKGGMLGKPINISCESLVKGGWIEEVKPIEKYVIYSVNMNIILSKLSDTAEKAEEYAKSEGFINYKILKASEVL